MIRAKAAGPDIEYGSAAELKGANKVWVYAGTNASFRAIFLEKLKKKIPSLTIVDSPEAADFQILLGNNSQTVFAGTRTTGSSGVYFGVEMSNARSEAEYARRTDVSAVVVKTLGPNRVRIIQNFDDYYEQKPDKCADRLIDVFAKSYKAANPSK